MDNADKKAIRHLRRFEDESGGLSPHEYHWHTVYPYPQYKCSGCGRKLGPGALVAKTFYPVVEFARKNPELLREMELAAMVRGTSLKSLLVTASDGVVYMRASTSFACAAHAAQLEKIAAKGPSWVYIEFERGPTTPRPSVVGPYSLARG